MILLPPETIEIVRSNFFLIIVSLLSYFAVFLLISYAANRKLTGEVGDYIVASRNLGWLVVTLTMYSSVLSGVGMAGIPGTVYSVGVPFVVTVLTGHTIALVLLWYFGPRIWILGKYYQFTTPGDLIGTYYQSDTVRLYTVLASILFNTAFIVAQLLAGGVLLNVLSGNLIPFQWGILIITAVVLLHVVTSGLRGIAWLDFFNGLVILLLLFLFGVAILLLTGGSGQIISGLADIKGRFITTPGMVGLFTPIHIYGVALGLSIGVLVLSPSAWIRIYSARSQKHFTRISVAMLVLWLISHVMGSFLIGAYGRQVMPSVENPDFVSSLLAFEALPVFFAALFLIAVLAAIISTTDTYLHTLTATIVHDLVRVVLHPDMEESREMMLNRTIIIVVAAVSVALAFLNPVLITPLAIFAGGITLQLLTPLLGAVTWARSTTEAAIIAPGAGILLTLVWELGILTNPLGMMPGLASAFCVNVVLFFVVSFLTRPQSPEMVEKFHGLIDRELR
ncbi:MAG: sodium:solute symporter family protein [Acidobacteriota bacterium]|nr:sodium:solute symporter family protein [Acidobacteriota bacterium]